jgi:hypothetical protein
MNRNGDRLRREIHNFFNLLSYSIFQGNILCLLSETDESMFYDIRKSKSDKTPPGVAAGTVRRMMMCETRSVQVISVRLPDWQKYTV